MLADDFANYFGKQAAAYGGDGEHKAKGDTAIAYGAIVVRFGVADNAAADEECGHAE